MIVITETDRPRTPRVRRRVPRVLRRLAAAERGAVLVEFALAMPILALLLVAIIDFAMAMFALNNLTLAVREGGRFASAKQTLSTNDPAVVSLVKTQIALSMARGGLDTTNASVTVALDTVPGTGTGLITVTASRYAYKPLTPIVNSFAIKRQAVFRWERFSGSP
jgi:Flp pilus assembly protein TadG